MRMGMPQRLSRHERQGRLLYLAIALLPLVGSFFIAHGLPLKLPGCPLMHFIGIPCPAWGLTRSFLAMARGDWTQAIAFHAFGPVIALGFLWLGLRTAIELIRGYKMSDPFSFYLRQPRIQILCFLVLLSYHATRLYTLWQTGNLPL